MLIVGCWQLSSLLEVSSAVAALTGAGQVLRQFREPRCCLQPGDSSSRDVTTQLVTGGAGCATGRAGGRTGTVDGKPGEQSTTLRAGGSSQLRSVSQGSKRKQK